MCLLLMGLLQKCLCFSIFYPLDAEEFVLWICIFIYINYQYIEMVQVVGFHTNLREKCSKFTNMICLVNAETWTHFNIKIIFSYTDIHIIKTRQSWNHHIFKLRIPLLLRGIFILKLASHLGTELLISSSTFSMTTVSFSTQQNILYQCTGRVIDLCNSYLFYLIPLFH